MQFENTKANQGPLLTRSLMVICYAAIASVCSALEITRHAITWTVEGSPTNGTYANGDPWVVGPIRITNITPASTLISERTMHGSMINPSAAPFPSHGFDSTLGGGANFITALNIGRPGGSDISVGNPLVVANGSSLVSVKSHQTASNRPQFTDVSILTVVASAPADGSFRPPYCGTDKTHHWNKSDLDYSILSRLPPVAGAKTPNQVAASFAKPWFELGTNSIGRNFHPANHMPEYGRDMGILLGEALLVLNLDYNPAEKELLYIRLVQWGIDLYGCAVTGGVWAANGGHNCARKAGVVLAALALADDNIKIFADKAQKFIFAEDQQTWYVVESDVGRPLYSDDGRSRVPYIDEDVGIAEWGEKHSQTPVRDGRNWDTYYRNVVYIGQVGEALSMQFIEGAKALWNWPPFFDYFDRAHAIYSLAATPTFVQNMWEAYRDVAPPSKNRVVVPQIFPNPGAYSGPVEVILSPGTGDSSIHYTLSGEPPNSSSMLYTASFTIDKSAVVKAISVRDGMYSQVVSASFEIGGDARLSSKIWQNFEFPAQLESHVVGFDIKAGSAPMDGFVGLSATAASNSDGLACIIRFAPDGVIDARNGGSFQALNALEYKAGVAYRAVVQVDFTNKQYSVVVISPDGSRKIIARQWLFHLEHSDIKSFANVGMFSFNNEYTLSNFRVNSPDDLAVFPARPGKPPVFKPVEASQAPVIPQKTD